MERLHQRLRQREAGGLDHDMLDRRHAREDLVERRHELVGDGAAEAAIGELDDVLLRAGGIAAALEDLAVDADIAELVDDHREPPTVGVGQHVADQRRLARAEKAGDDGAGDARKRRTHSLSSSRNRWAARGRSARASAFRGGRATASRRRWRARTAWRLRSGRSRRASRRGRRTHRSRRPRA